MWHGSFAHMTWLICAFEMTQSHTRWRRLIGTPKLQIIFHKRATKYRSLLWKMTNKHKGSYESSPHCTCGPSFKAVTQIGIHFFLQMCDVTHSYMRFDSFLYVKWLNNIRGDLVSRPPGSLSSTSWANMGRDSFVYVTWLILTCEMTQSHTWRPSFEAVRQRVIQFFFCKCVTWLVHMCAMSHSYMWYVWFIYVILLIHMCDITHSYTDITHSYMWYYSFICVIWLIHIWDMPHPCMWYDSFIYVGT